MYILRYDDDLTSSFGANLTNYTGNWSEWAVLEFKKFLDPTGWAVPFVTGHKYKIGWTGSGLDFTSMSMTLSTRWQTTDKSLYFLHNFIDRREAIRVNVNG